MLKIGQSTVRCFRKKVLTIRGVLDGLKNRLDIRKIEELRRFLHDSPVMPSSGNHTIEPTLVVLVMPGLVRVPRNAGQHRLLIDLQLRAVATQG